MANVYLMNDKKEIANTQKSANYQNENNCEIIRLILPTKYNNVDLRKCKINMNYINSKNQGDIIPLEYIGQYNNSNDLIIFETNLTTKITANADTYIVWFDITSVSGDFNLKTNTSTLLINSHKEIIDYISDEQLTLFNNYQIKIEQLLVTANQILNKTTEQANKTADIAQLVVRMYNDIKGE